MQMNPTSWIILPFILVISQGVFQVLTESDIIHDADVRCDASRIVFTISKTSRAWRMYGGNLTVFNRDSKPCKVAGSHFIYSPPGPFHVTIAFKICQTQLKAVLGTGGDPYEYYTNQHFIIAGNNGLDYFPTGATNFTAFVYCWIGAHAHADTGTNGTAGGGGGGGGTMAATNAVELNVTDLDGNPIYDVTLGEPLVLTIRKKLDNFDYNATLPTYCYFTDHIGGHDTPTARVPFIVDKCPNNGIMNAFDHILRMEKINVTQYQVMFKAFTFSGAQGGLGITCEMLVCLNSSDGQSGGLCHKDCWSRPWEKHRSKRSAKDQSRGIKSRVSVHLRVRTALPSEAKISVQPIPTSDSTVTFHGPLNDDSIPLSQHLLFLYVCLGALGALVLLLLFALFCLCFARQKSGN